MPLEKPGGKKTHPFPASEMAFVYIVVCDGDCILAYRVGRITLSVKARPNLMEVSAGYAKDGECKRFINHC